MKEVERLNLDVLLVPLEAIELDEWERWGDVVLNCVAVDEPKSMTAVRLFLANDVDPEGPLSSLLLDLA
jgi:hypothetical protein